MGRIAVAVRAFFGALFNRATADRVDTALRGGAIGLPAPEKQAKPAPAQPPRPAAPERPARSDALILLAALQREARFVDFLMEPIESYTDAQIGAAARAVHRGCHEAVQRMFSLAPLLAHQEGAAIDVPAPLDPDRFRLLGAVSGDAPYRGKLVHPGWHATAVKVPTWNGNRQSAQVVAPAEVEL